MKFILHFLKIVKEKYHFQDRLSSENCQGTLSDGGTFDLRGFIEGMEVFQEGEGLIGGTLLLLRCLLSPVPK